MGSIPTFGITTFPHASSNFTGSCPEAVGANPDREFGQNGAHEAESTTRRAVNAQRPRLRKPGGAAVVRIGCFGAELDQTAGATYGVTVTALPPTFTSETPLPAMLTGQREVAWYTNVAPP